MGESSPMQDSAPRVIWVIEGARLADLESYLQEEIGRFASEFVFVVDREVFAEADTNKVARADLLKRSNHRPVSLLTLNKDSKKHVLKSIATEGTGPESDDVAELARADLLGLALEAQEHSFFRPDPHFHYLSPSSKHCSTFFRLGDAIHSANSLDRLAFWIAPSIASAGALLVDTWSISAAILRAMTLLGMDVPFDCLTSHPQHDQGAAKKIISGLRDRLPSDKMLLSLVSVTSSGRYSDLVDERCNDLCVKVEHLAIFSLEGAPSKWRHLCALPHSPKNYASRALCVHCNSGSSLIQVDPTLYYFRAHSEHELPLKKDHFGASTKGSHGRIKSIVEEVKKAQADVRAASRRVWRVAKGEQLQNRPEYTPVRDFLDLYGETERLFRAHHNAVGGAKHHAFSIDTKTLTSTDTFKRRLSSLLSNLNFRPDVILAPDDGVSETLAREVGQRYSVPTFMLDHSQVSAGFDSLPGSMRVVAEARNFLIVDDCSITGTRLTTLNASLRRRTAPIERIEYVVGFARPTSKKSWESLSRVLTKNVDWTAHLTSVETLILPDWDAIRCPWCAEVQLLSSIARNRYTRDSWIDDRLASLSVVGGIYDEALLLMPGVAPGKLGQGSLAGKAALGSMPVVFSLAAALQNLRTCRREPLDPTFPSYRVFARRNLENYSEQLIRACLIRAVAPQEWGSLGREDLTNSVQGYAEEPGGDILIGEALLAAYRQTLEPDTVSRLRSEFASRVSPDDWTAIVAAFEK